MEDYIGWILSALATWGLVLFIAYFLPVVIALLRGHQDKMAIFVLTLLLGWSGIAWVAALVWSFTGVRRKSET